MDNSFTYSQLSRHAQRVFSAGLSLDITSSSEYQLYSLRQRTKRRPGQVHVYSTERVLTGLMRAGFVPVDARQTNARKAWPIARSACHSSCVDAWRRCSLRDSDSRGSAMERPRRIRGLPAETWVLLGSSV